MSLCNFFDCFLLKAANKTYSIAKIVATETEKSRSYGYQVVYAEFDAVFFELFEEDQRYQMSQSPPRPPRLTNRAMSALAWKAWSKR